MTNGKSEKLQIAEARLARAKARAVSMAEDNRHELRVRQQEFGKVEEWFGSRENAALYIAIFLVGLALLILGAIAYGEPSLRADIAKAVGAIAIAGLGYIGGLLSK